MSLFFVGASQCAVCRQTIQQGESTVSFPAFVWDQADPLLLFNDATVHSDCFVQHPLAEKADAVVEELMAKTGPGRRKCVVCQAEILDPDDCLLIPRLASDPSDPLHRFNLTHLHRTHARQWTELDGLVALLKSRQDAGSWIGDGLRPLIRDLERSQSENEP